MVVSVSQLTSRSYLRRSAQKGGFDDTPRIHSFTLPSDQDPFLSQLHRRGITCRLTFDGSSSSHLQEIFQDLSVYDCIFL